MFQQPNKAPLQSDSMFCSFLCSVPGKVFLLGEYAVLTGQPALVATVSPRFQMSITQGNIRENVRDSIRGNIPANVRENESQSEVHPLSPLGRFKTWLKETGKPEFAFQWNDPYRGAGGFGASTAQFAMAYLASIQNEESNDLRKWSAAWKLYRELMKDEPIPPSGADLVAQWQGGVVFFDPSDGHCMDVWPIFDWSSLLVFSATAQEGGATDRLLGTSLGIPPVMPAGTPAGRKVPTHEHLRDLAKEGQGFARIPALEKIILQGISAVRENDGVEFGRALDDYADVLQKAGLEAPAATADREALRDLPGVLGVKGTGALQSDAMIVLMESQSPHREQVIEMAKQRGLVLVTEGLSCQTGITCQRGAPCLNQ